MHAYQFIRKIEKVHLLIGFLLRLTIFTWPTKIEYHQIKEPLAVAIMILGRCVPLCALCYMYTALLICILYSAPYMYTPQRSFNQSKCISKFFSNTFPVYNWFGSKNRIEKKHTPQRAKYTKILWNQYMQTQIMPVKWNEWTDQIGMTIQFCFDKETTRNDCICVCVPSWYACHIRWNR